METRITAKMDTFHGVKMLKNRQIAAPTISQVTVENTVSFHDISQLS